jgi:polysaccharide deacetylase family protein (PEP-CTERM system associated)
MIPNALTIDVEDYYSVMARDRLGLAMAPTEAVVRNTGRLLALLADRGIKATFFVLGEVAEAFPRLVRDMAAAGHEIGVHGYLHRPVFGLSREEFRQDVGRTKKLLEDIVGGEVVGHRAPAFSVVPETAWALEELADLGFRYDSSVFPFAGRRYGWPEFPRDIHRRALTGGRAIVEVPLSVVPVLGRAVPACGGGYLRHFPYAFTRWAMRRVTRERPAVVYLHPYETDLERGPEEFERALAAAPLTVRMFHRNQLRNRDTVARKVARLVEEFDFAPLREVIEGVVIAAGRRG